MNECTSPPHPQACRHPRTVTPILALTPIPTLTPAVTPALSLHTPIAPPRPAHTHTHTCFSSSQEWEGIEFTCKAWKDTGTYILAEIDEIQQLMDDQIVKTQAMRGSR